jgi:tRNA G10  N-methylase Trm11
MRYLVQFSQEFHWVNFRFVELDSLLLMNGVEPSTAYNYDESAHGTEDAFLCINLPGSDAAKLICERSILIKSIYELWCYAPTLKLLIDEARGLPKTFLQPYMTAEKSWSINVDSHCKSYSMSEKESCRNNFRFLDFKGVVSLDNADVQLWVLLDHSQQKNDSEVGDNRLSMT